MSDLGLSSAWLVASNTRVFDSDSAFAVQDEIDWSETSSAHIKTGDTVWLYGTSPLSALTHECRVEETGIGFDRLLDDADFWTDLDAREARNARSRMRLHLERTFTPTERRRLSLPALVDHGLRAAPQGRMRAPASVQRLIADVMSAAVRPSDDSTAEADLVDGDLVAGFRAAIGRGEFGVPDQLRLGRRRGSAQRVFAEVVKRNYGYRCAATGIRTREFLVASHIVPWAYDESIRLDPSNGICLSTLVDRAFDTGYVSIDSSLRIVVHRERMAHDPELLATLVAMDGRQLAKPIAHTPRAEYIARRRAMWGEEV